jgi:hypothetical protein
MIDHRLPGTVRAYRYQVRLVASDDILNFLSEGRGVNSANFKLEVGEKQRFTRIFTICSHKSTSPQLTPSFSTKNSSSTMPPLYASTPIHDHIILEFDFEDDDDGYDSDMAFDPIACDASSVSSMDSTQSSSLPTAAMSEVQQQFADNKLFEYYYRNEKVVESSHSSKADGVQGLLRYLFCSYD